ncbi:hypothetical protein [Nitrosospira sp. Nsp13]|uniref:hypothetical protein n=1 Tax=Nitrosospira sp. Nsp13 TaxID=1855332 RepID=UPI00088E1FFB|nr:hypothetical protein [Nitrosospira sp. Nsp13]SCY58559.1 hypothetical protein SAMN05216308_1219 [Nitrosospira sp. Nsp13]
MVVTLGRKVKNIFTALSTVGLLASCAPMATYETGEDPAGATGIQNTATPSEHKTLAKYHDDRADDLWVKAKEQKQLLEHYEEKSYLYGKRAQDLQAHTSALIRNYERAATANIKEAAAHRRIASELEKNNSSAARPQKVNVIY